MPDWYLAHQDQIQYWLDWALYTDAFRKLSALMYVIFAVGLFALGTEYHTAMIRKDRSIGQFPEGYFTMLVVQLLPLTITGFVLQDAYIIGTRIGTLLVVLIVYGMVTSVDGTFHTWRYRLWVTFWLSAAILGPMIWVESEAVRAFVHDWEKWIAWSAVVAMILFVAGGQREVATTLFLHFVRGNYSVRRFSLQVVRFFAFALQAVHYWFMPTRAAPFLGLDPIFLQGALGTLGVAMVLIGSIFGFIFGTKARHEKRDALRAQAKAAS
jgi:hypothetical protein